MFEDEESIGEDFYSGDAFIGDASEKGVHAGGMEGWDFQMSGSGEMTVRLDIVAGPDENEAPEWQVELKDAGFEIWESSSQKKPEVKLELDGAHPKEMRLEVMAPKGARYGDTVTVKVTAVSPSLIEVDSIEFKGIATASIMALKTQIGHERAVADGVTGKAKGPDGDVFAILSPTNLRGYVLVEGMNTDRLRDLVRGVKKARTFVEGETELHEIDHYLTPKPIVSGISEGDVVELVAGPFKGEKARVMNIDEGKEEITVELFEAMVPIPITVRGDHVRVIEKER